MPADHGKQFTIYDHVSGPNPWKVKMILEELGLTYHSIWMDMTKGEHKGPEYTKLNPNGRLPTIIDHTNNDFILWESGAIVLYLIERYDKENKLSYKLHDNNDWLTKQWLMFQMSGQGPYYGQSFWFKLFHGEKLPSAIERYEQQAARVLEVIDNHLKATGQQWLVGDKCTYADISFVPWNLGLDMVTGMGPAWKEKYPLCAGWVERTTSRPAIKKMVDSKNEMAQKK